MKRSVTFKDIERARKMLGLGDTASMEKVRESYRSLMFKFHPDRHSSSKDKDVYEEKVKEINNAYGIIINYCIRYPISFTRDKVKNIEEGEYQKQHFDRFYSGWVGKE